MADDNGLCCVGLELDRGRLDKVDGEILGDLDHDDKLDTEHDQGLQSLAPRNGNGSC